MTPELAIEKSFQNNSVMDAYASLFIQNFATGRREGSFTGISGRVIRGTTPENFETLTDDPKRKIVYMLDSSGLNNLIGLNGREVLDNIGYSPVDVEKYLAKGTRFKVVFFPETSVHLANWNNLLSLTSQAYPEWRNKIIDSYNHLTMLPYDQVINMDGVVGEVRRFLHQNLNVNELYRGDGTTPNGIKEYITLNKRIDSFTSYTIIDFPVK